MVMVSPGPPASGSQADTPTRAVEEAPAGLVAGTRGLLAAFAGLTSLAVLALLVFSANARHAFAWSIHMELTAAFLGAAYAAGCVLSVLALRRGTWRGGRHPPVSGGGFTAPPLLADLVPAPQPQPVQGRAVRRSAAWVWGAV